MPTEQQESETCFRQYLRKVGEYFFGTETKRFYSKERNWYREFISDTNLLRATLDYSRREENADIIGGKIIPNVISLGGVALSIFLRDPIYYFIPVCSEAMRCACNANFQTRRLLKTSGRANFYKNNSSLYKLDDLWASNDADDDAGEEWKHKGKHE